MCSLGVNLFLLQVLRNKIAFTVSAVLAVAMWIIFDGRFEVRIVVKVIDLGYFYCKPAFDHAATATGWRPRRLESARPLLAAVRVCRGEARNCNRCLFIITCLALQGALELFVLALESGLHAITGHFTRIWCAALTHLTQVLAAAMIYKYKFNNNWSNLDKFVYEIC